MSTMHLNLNFCFCFSHNTESTDWCHPLEKAGAYSINIILYTCMVLRQDKGLYSMTTTGELSLCGNTCTVRDPALSTPKEINVRSLR